MILIYVDDLSITRDDISIIDEVKKKLQQVFRTKDLGNLVFLGNQDCKIKQRDSYIAKEVCFRVISSSRFSRIKTV